MILVIDFNFVVIQFEKQELLIFVYYYYVFYLAFMIVRIKEY